VVRDAAREPKGGRVVPSPEFADGVGTALTRLIEETRIRHRAPPAGTIG